MSTEEPAPAAPPEVPEEPPGPPRGRSTAFAGLILAFVGVAIALTAALVTVLRHRH